MSQTQSTLPVEPDIENSVRMFRLFEALRRGDTTIISKAINESSTERTEDGFRQSTSTNPSSGPILEGTSILHLAVQCADVPIVEHVLSSSAGTIDVNGRDKDGNTPLHIAAMLNRPPVVRLLLEQAGINDALANYQGRTALDLAKNPEVFQQLQLARSMYIDSHVKDLQRLVLASDYDNIERLLSDSHFQRVIDVNGGELTTDPSTNGTLLHEAVRKKDGKLIEILLLNGADPFRRDRKGKLPQDVTKDDKIRGLLKKSPAAAAAQRGIQEKTILGSGGVPAISGAATGENALGGREGREMKGFLKKWVNYTTGYKLRWFVLEDGVLSYYKHQDDAGAACRGAINMRIAQLHMDTQDKLKFEIIGKSSVKYHLKANHQVEAKRWFWALNNAIQYSKDEAKARAKSDDQNAERFRQAKAAEVERKHVREAEPGSTMGSRFVDGSSVPGNATGIARTSTQTSRELQDDEDGTMSTYDPSLAGDDIARVATKNSTAVLDGDADQDDDFGDDASSIEAQPVSKDAFMIAAHSARLQLELLAQISSALKNEKSRNPNAPISTPSIAQALSSYEAAVGNLNALVGDLGRIARDREAFWQYRLDQEVNVRRIWEDNMLKVAREHEELENRIGESEEKRKRTKRALRDALEHTTASVPVTDDDISQNLSVVEPQFLSPKTRTASTGRRKSTFAEMANIAGSESEDEDDEFFDAVGAGEVEVVQELPPPRTRAPPEKEVLYKPVEDVPAVEDMPAVEDLPAVEHLPVATNRNEEPSVSHVTIETSFRGYEDPVRKKLNLDADNRPKISLWGILKSMIGKDMTKMTLPVSFNEPTSLLQRVAEDMEYTELLDTAASRADSTERMVYVAAFAASEYASTIGRVAKPFNPLLHETYEYVRPDKGYRFFIEQVSHHPPIGAAWAESALWDYYGESAVRSNFTGKSFIINPLGTWFLKLRPASSGGREELYTWKKVTSSVVGIITGNPTIDNSGLMEVKNHTTKEVCILDFKPRGWKASSQFQVSGKVTGHDGATRWSITGKWNEKIYASKDSNPNKAFLVWECHTRPTGIPFNLTPFGVTLNALPSALRQYLPPTDTRLRPDQRSMEEGDYPLAETEKNRVEEKQRATRRNREQKGEEVTPRWFKKGKCSVTGEEFWIANGSTEDKENVDGVEYWQARANSDWKRCEDIF